MINLDAVIQAQKNWQAAQAEGGPRLGRFAFEALDRCAEAVAVLAGNLDAIGYSWTAIEKIDEDQLAANLATIETAIGAPVPDILAMFWKQVGGVALVDLERYQHVSFWEEHQLAGPLGFCDGLYIQACNQGWVDFVGANAQDWQEYRPADAPETYLLELSPDGYHKDDISGGAPYGLLPGQPWAPIWQYFDWPGYQRPACAGDGPPDFLTYLRASILECAGFPAFLGLPAFDPLRERLLQGVLVF